MTISSPAQSYLRRMTYMSQATAAAPASPAPPPVPTPACSPVDVACIQTLRERAVAFKRNALLYGGLTGGIASYALAAHAPFVYWFAGPLCILVVGVDLLEARMAQKEAAQYEARCKATQPTP